MAIASRSRPEDVRLPIVVLEDDRTVAALIGQSLAAAQIVNPLEFFDRGQDAVEHLMSSADGGRLPVLIVLDISVPDVSGLDVLRRVRARPELAGVPVVMLSGSGEEQDIEEAYTLGIDAYLVKPAGIHGLPDVITGLSLPHLLLPRAK
jgi:DNA-binding response OmpR family regulator